MFYFFQWPLLTTYPVLSPRADRTCHRKKTTLALSPRYAWEHTAWISVTQVWLQNYSHLFLPSFPPRRTGPAPRRTSEHPPSAPPAMAWPLPARPWPWSMGFRKETVLPFATPRLEQDFMANSVPACINLNLKQMSEKYLTKYLNSYYESEKVQKNDKRIYLKTHVNGVCYPIYQYLVLI